MLYASCCCRRAAAAGWLQLHRRACDCDRRVLPLPPPDDPSCGCSCWDRGRPKDEAEVVSCRNVPWRGGRCALVSSRAKVVPPPATAAAAACPPPALRRELLSIRWRCLAPASALACAVCGCRCCRCCGCRLERCQDPSTAAPVGRAEVPGRVVLAKPPADVSAERDDAMKGSPGRASG
jgi:hypothetical protein